MTKRDIRIVEGIRSIYAVWVILVHIFMHSGFLASRRGAEYLRLHKTFILPRLGSLLGLQVDVFFLLSGFLFTLQYRKSFKKYSLFGGVVYTIMKKFFRIAPIASVVFGLSYLSNDYNADKLSYLIGILTFDLRYVRHGPVALGPSWSNSVDVNACVILSILLYILYGILDMKYIKDLPSNTRKIGLYVLGTLIVCGSLYPKLLNYLSDPVGFSYIRVLLENDAQYEPGKQKWVIDYFNMTHLEPEYAVLKEYSGAIEHIMDNEYTVTSFRWTPFFIGWFIGMLTLLPEYEAERQKELFSVKTKEEMLLYERAQALVSKQSKVEKTSTDKMHVFCFLLATLGLLFPIVTAFTGSQIVAKRNLAIRAAWDYAQLTSTKMIFPPMEPPSFIIDIISSVFLRSIYAASVGYFLSCSLSVNENKMNVNTSSKATIRTAPVTVIDRIISWYTDILSVKFFQSFGSITFCMYMIHMRISLDITHYYLSPSVIFKMVDYLQVTYIQPIGYLKNIDLNNILFTRHTLLNGDSTLIVGNFHFFIWITSILTVTICVSFILHHMIEVPCKKFTDKLVEKNMSLSILGREQDIYMNASDSGDVKDKII